MPREPVVGNQSAKLARLPPPRRVSGLLEWVLREDFEFTQEEVIVSGEL